MFIHEFCGYADGAPFLKAVCSETQKDLQRVRGSAVSEVWIDTSKGLDIEAGKASQSQEEVAAEAEARLLAATVEQERPQRASPDDEVARALKLCSRSREAVVAGIPQAMRAWVLRSRPNRRRRWWRKSPTRYCVTPMR